jgi:polysaccharide pyruvyl transferase WcaK-like protein
VQSFADKYKIEGKYVCSATCCPEDLIEEVGSCRAIISFRLHPSIIAFSLNVPSIGIVWNSKVCDFYNAIGYKDRCFEVNEKLTAENIVDAVKSAITEGVKKDEIYLMSVYSTLLSALVQVFNIQSVQPLSYEELCEQLSGLHPKLTISRYRSRVATKTRRLYRHFTKRPGDFRELIRDSDEQIFSSKEIGKR